MIKKYKRHLIFSPVIGFAPWILWAPNSCELGLMFVTEADERYCHIVYVRLSSLFNTFIKLLPIKNLYL